MIKAGYQITITSWSNDGDNDRDVVVSGLTKERVQYIIAICKLFTGAKHGNMYDQDLDSPKVSLAIIDMLAVASAYEDILTKEEFEYIKEDPSAYMAEFLGYEEDYTFRVFESYKVYFIPQDIPEVTAEFN